MDPELAEEAYCFVSKGFGSVVRPLACDARMLPGCSLMAYHKFHITWYALHHALR
jgi:hypothetical protein